MHALIIVDEFMIAMAIEDIIRDLGFTSFDLASSPETAIEAAAKRRPDLITSDVRLDPECGITPALKICESLVIPVIFITGNAADVELRAPTYCTLSKPVSAGQLAAAVAAAFK